MGIVEKVSWGAFSKARVVQEVFFGLQIKEIEGELFIDGS